MEFRENTKPNKNSKLKALFAILFVIAVSAVTAVITVTLTISSLMSPDITVTHNGVVQTMRDSDGTIVYTIEHNGSKYIPLTLVSDMLDVHWDDETRTVDLSTASPEEPVELEEPAQQDDTIRLSDVIGLGSGHIAYWSYIEAAYGEPLAITDFANGGTTQFRSALRATPISSGNRRIQYTLNDSYNQLNFTLYGANVAYPMMVTVFDADTNDIRWTGPIRARESQEVMVNISGVRTIRITASGHWRDDGVVYLLDPTVK